ncbi:RnfH family protein [Ningiella sp. W23]|uniref:RnfH family protein n=1 Tax=Ningiella sp. W23 TaxID=3023715 RepID=UPI0037581F41
MPSQLTIEIAYALPEKQSLMRVAVPDGTTVQKAIEQSGLLSLYQEIDLSVNKVGIWNKVCKVDAVVSEGDRIEIYRPLIADPKEVRKLRAQKAKEEGRANKVTGGKPL